MPPIHNTQERRQAAHLLPHLTPNAVCPRALGAGFQETFSNSCNESGVEESDTIFKATTLGCVAMTTRFHYFQILWEKSSHQQNRKEADCLLFMGENSACPRMYLLILLEHQTRPKQRLPHTFLEQTEPFCPSVWDEEWCHPQQPL